MSNLVVASPPSICSQNVKIYKNMRKTHFKTRSSLHLNFMQFIFVTCLFSFLQFLLTFPGYFVLLTYQCWWRTNLKSMQCTGARQAKSKCYRQSNQVAMNLENTIQQKYILISFSTIFLLTFCQYQQQSSDFFITSKNFKMLWECKQLVKTAELEHKAFRNTNVRNT